MPPSHVQMDDNFMARAEQRRLAQQQAAVPPPNTSGTQYDDPYTSMFEQRALARMNSLSQQGTDPAFDQVMSLIRSRVGNLTNAAPVSFAPVSFSVNNPYMGEFANSARSRMAELNQEPFSDQEEARMRSRALEGVEINRSGSRQRALEDAARRGLGESSGVIQERFAQVDRGADSDRTKAESDLAMFTTTERNRRKDAAVQLAQGLAAMGSQEAAMGLQAQTSAASLNQQGQIAGAQINQGREGQILQMAGMIADLAAQKRGEARANQNDILAIAQNLANLGPQRMAQLMSVFNGIGGDPSGVFNNTLNMSNTQANQNNQNSAANQNMMNGLGQILAYYASQPQGR